MTDSEKLKRAAARKGWPVTTSGRTLILRRGDRSITATFSDDGKLETFLVGHYRGRGGMAGIRRIMEAVS